jgi:tetratricopeptide (TPR) repeat protein
LITSRALRGTLTLTLGLGLLAVLGGPGVAAAQTEAQTGAQAEVRGLAALAEALASEDDARRQDAYAALGSLPGDALPAIRARLAELQRARPLPEDAQEILQQLRRATGSRRADDIVDVADGIPAVLAERRDRDVLRMAEPLLLLRSLEGIATTEALSLVPEVLRLDPRAWTMEGRRSTLRLGDRAAAALIRARAHPDPAAREWARWSGRELSLEDAGRLVQRLGPRDLADVLRAWGATRSIDAMPVVASFVDDPRRLVREAARDALRDYGQNAVWQAREQFRLRLGTDAELGWGWARTLDELCARLDTQRLARVADLEQAAREALERGDTRAATESLEALLARAPDAGSHDIAVLFARTGEAWMGADERTRARLAYERAVRLSPSDEDRARWEARLSFVEAEDALARGVLDLEAYRRAAAGDPSCARCAEVLGRLEAQAAPAVVAAAGSVARRQGALALAAGLFAVLGAWLLAGRRRAVDERAHDDEGQEPLASDATLPG